MERMENGSLRIGTSGWVYPHWRGPFYPPSLPQAAWLDYYARRFDTVEINRSFYRLPTPKAAAEWAVGSPHGFCFAVKASRYLTHMKKLKDPDEPLSRLQEAIAPLNGKLGPILYQLPPRWRFDADRLAQFLALLPKDQRHVLEFRDPSWFTPEAYRLLERHEVALCVVSFPGVPVVWEATAPFTYVRLHGATKAYDYRYSEAELEDWATGTRRYLEQGLDAYVYFDNDAHGYAVENALRLRDMLEGLRSVD
jgi:uncharacterized protein YecE (DUF72 family)